MSTMKCWFFFTLFLSTYCISTTGAFRCQSCFAGCQNFDDCDCEGDTNSICHAPYCYAKLEYFSDDGISAVQKGCTNHISTSFLGCQYASDDRSIACFCSGDLCNSAANLSLNQAPKLPVVNCCECNDEEEENEDETGGECFTGQCRHNCTGNYCYLDLVANAQGCGWGHPQLFHFLRTPKYRRWEHELTCAEYYDNNRNYMSGCTCSKDYCNSVRDLDRLKPRQPAQLNQDNSHFCHSLYLQSHSPFGGEVYRRASLCRSQFCFVSWSSVEVGSDGEDEKEYEFGQFESGQDETRLNEDTETKLGYLPTLRPMFEISAGCLHVDQMEKVHTGCTTEWSGSQTKPLTRHCVCNEKLCNDFHLIENTDLPGPPELEEPPQQGPTVIETNRPPVETPELVPITEIPRDVGTTQPASIGPQLAETIQQSSRRPATTESTSSTSTASTNIPIPVVVRKENTSGDNSPMVGPPNMGGGYLNETDPAEGPPNIGNESGSVEGPLNVANGTDSMKGPPVSNGNDLVEVIPTWHSLENVTSPGEEAKAIPSQSGPSRVDFIDPNTVITGSPTQFDSRSTVPSTAAPSDIHDLDSPSVSAGQNVCGIFNFVVFVFPLFSMARTASL